MMRLKPDNDAMNDQIVTRPCNWLNWENTPMLNAALIAVMVEMTNDAPAASTSPNRIALTTTRMKANTTMSGRPRSPGASMIEAQQTSSPNSHRLPSGQCAAKSPHQNRCAPAATPKPKRRSQDRFPRRYMRPAALAARIPRIQSRSLPIRRAATRVGRIDKWQQRRRRSADWRASSFPPGDAATDRMQQPPRWTEIRAGGG